MNRGEQPTQAERMAHLQGLIGRMRRGAERLPTLAQRQAAAGNADVVQWAHDRINELEKANPER